MSNANNGNAVRVGSGNNKTLEGRIDGCMDNLKQLTQDIRNNHKELIQQINDLRDRIEDVDGSLKNTRNEIFREGSNISGNTGNYFLTFDSTGDAPCVKNTQTKIYFASKFDEDSNPLLVALKRGWNPQQFDKIVDFLGLYDDVCFKSMIETDGWRLDVSDMDFLSQRERQRFCLGCQLLAEKHHLRISG